MPTSVIDVLEVGDDRRTVVVAKQTRRTAILAQK
jgi:hypothetical protein